MKRYELGYGGLDEAVDGDWVMYKDVVAAYRDSEIETLRAKLADCQGVIRSRGHDADCERNWCRHCDVAMHAHTFPISHPLESRPCSDACGHDRTTGEKA